MEILNQLEDIKTENVNEIMRGTKRAGNTLYGFVANNYSEMTKEELKSVILNLIGAVEDKHGYKEALEVETRAITNFIEEVK